jgi:hypothetical protein
LQFAKGIFMDNEGHLLNRLAYFFYQLQDFKWFKEIKEWKIHPDGNVKKGTFTLWITFNNGKRKEYRAGNFDTLFEIPSMIFNDLKKDALEKVLGEAY